MALDLESAASRVASGRIRTAGRIEFVRDQGPVRRDIRVKDFEWNPDTLRNLTKILWAVERAHSYGLSALRLFSKMPSSEFSPDGLLGGRGYIQQVRDMRAALGQSVETLSSFTDTVHDEINAPHWGSAGEDPVSTETMENAEEVKSDPEGFVEKQFQEDVSDQVPGQDQEPISNPTPDEYNPFFENEDEDSDWWGSDDDDQPRMSSYRRVADSSIDPSTLPGPRVMHIGPGESPEEFGYFTDNGEVPSDDPLGEGFSHLDPIVDDGGMPSYSNPTDGDESVFKTSADSLMRSGATYSWLPGADNQKILNYYEPGLTEAEVKQMRANSDPDPPPSMRRKISKPKSDPLWKARREASNAIRPSKR